MSEAADTRWVGAQPQMVFEDAHLRVMFQPGGSDMLLLTFGDAVTLADGTRFFADSVAGKFGINCLGFMARAPNWYPAGSMRAAARAVAYTLAAFGVRIAYGSSMGAYAAIKYSALLGATQVLAYCPQWSIDPAECGENESGYRDFFRPEMTGMGVVAGDVAGCITVFYDPGQKDDVYHYSTLARLSPRVRACRVHYAAHYLAPVLAGSRLATALFLACHQGDTARLYALINTPRRASVHRRRHLLVASATRHPLLTLAALRQVVRAGQAGHMDGARCLMALYRALRARGEDGRADELVTLLLPAVSEGRAKLLTEDLQASPSPPFLLRSAHGHVLCYSALGGCLTQVAWPLAQSTMPGLLPASVYGGLVVVRVDGLLYRCEGKDVDATELVPASLPAPSGCFEAVPAAPGAFHLRSSGYYATAEPDGTIWRSAPQPREWEVFTAIRGETFHSGAGDV